VAVLGVPLALTTYSGVLDWIDAAIAADSREYVCVAATHTVVACGEDPALRTAVLGSSLTVPDGMPLVWALKALGHPLPDRVYGPELMARSCARAAERGIPVFLYGGRDRWALDRLVAQLTERFPGLPIAGTLQPRFRALSDTEAAAVAAEINASGAQIVWCGLGVPRQEQWMERLRPLLDAPVLIGVGAAFDFHAGLVPQAPPALQRLGLEWAFRLAQEPRRLWRRYAHHNPRFVLWFARQWLVERRQRPSGR
jgi:N-acetylglucosaminyldiphosphoundecaprenol N-acetyl-beta-D-mannosaminyltransferase